jgi:hypothetical protein
MAVQISVSIFAAISLRNFVIFMSFLMKAIPS